MEQNLIKVNRGRIYNVVEKIKKEADKIKKPVKHKEIIYSSISEAARILKIFATTIRRKARNSLDSSWEFVKNSKNQSAIPNIEKARAVYVHGIYYRSQRNAAVQTGINGRTLIRHLEYPKHTYCYYEDQYFKSPINDDFSEKTTKK